MEDTNTDISINQRISIPGDHVQSALKRLVEQGEIDEAGRDEIYWLYSYAMNNNWNLEDVGKAIDKDATTAYRMFLGRYGARYDNLIEEVARYHKIAVARGQRKTVGFVETTTWSKIEQVCRHAFIGQLPAFIYGASQIGKTESLKEYQRRNNHGQTKYIRMPASPSFPFFIKTVAEACFVSTRMNNDITRRRIMDALNSKNLILIDEVHQALITVSESTARKIMEFVREIYDRTECGVVLCGTNVFRDEFERGRQKLIFDQFRRRSIIQLTLPEVAPRADIVKIAKAYSLPAPDGVADDLVGRMIKQSGLGQYVKFIQSASNLAANQKKTLTWDHFVQSYDIINSLSTTTR